MKRSTKKIEAEHGGLLLYIIEATTPERQWVKVGITTELIGRIKMIACGCPIAIDLVWYRDIGMANIAEWAEIAVHADLAPLWSSGEWFVVSSDSDLRARIDKIASRFCKPHQWRSVRFDDSPWRKRTNRGEKLAQLAERRAEGIEDLRRASRETPMRMQLSATEISAVYQPK